MKWGAISHYYSGEVTRQRDNSMLGETIQDRLGRVESGHGEGRERGRVEEGKKEKA